MNLPPALEYCSRQQQDHYRAMIEDGQEPGFALMCSLGQPPAHKGTDRTLMQRRYNAECLDDMPPHRHAAFFGRQRRQYITEGKFYMSGLADKGHQDPEHGLIS